MKEEKGKWKREVTWENRDREGGWDGREPCSLGVEWRVGERGRR